MNKNLKISLNFNKGTNYSYVINKIGNGNSKLEIF